MRQSGSCHSQKELKKIKKSDAAAYFTKTSPTRNQLPDVSFCIRFAELFFGEEKQDDVDKVLRRLYWVLAWGKQNRLQKQKKRRVAVLLPHSLVFFPISSKKASISEGHSPQNKAFAVNLLQAALRCGVGSVELIQMSVCSISLRCQESSLLRSFEAKDHRWRENPKVVKPKVSQKISEKATLNPFAVSPPITRKARLFTSPRSLLGRHTLMALCRSSTLEPGSTALFPERFGFWKKCSSWEMFWGEFCKVWWCFWIRCFWWFQGRKMS